MCIFLKKECKKITIIIHVLQYIYMYFVISQIFYDVMHIPISYPNYIRVHAYVSHTGIWKSNEEFVPFLKQFLMLKD